MNQLAELEIYKSNLEKSISSYKNISDYELLDTLEEWATKIGKSWSGSWIGYQSRVYYSDFKQVPAGAHFSSEWGFYENILKDTRGNWKEYQFDFVKEYILNKAKINNFGSFEKELKIFIDIIEDTKNNIKSILDIYLSKNKDKYIYDTLEKINNFKIPTNNDWLTIHQPKGQFYSRDMLAMSQGISSPPHLWVLSMVFEYKSPDNYGTSFIDIIDNIISHLTRRKSNILGTKMSEKIFIGHGNSRVWKDLKDFLQDRLKLDWEEFNRISSAGKSNKEKLSDMLNTSTFAFLVMTAEDELQNGSLNPRINVVHESGLFQGRLGFHKAIILLEEGCEQFSNIEGLGQIRFPAGNISAKFEEIRMVLEREGIIIK